MVRKITLGCRAPMLIVSLLLACNAVASLQYEIIDLGTLGGNESGAYAINNNNQIVGYAYSNQGCHATLFDRTGAGSNLPIGGTSSTALSINDLAQIVGWSEGGRATLFDSSGAANNIYLDPTGAYGNTAAASINNLGDIVGWSFGWQAISFDPSGAGNNIVLDNLPGGSAARHINNSGQIVGYDGNRAALFVFGRGITVVHLGGFLPDSYSEARSINNLGQIVGEASYWDYTIHATLFDPTGAGNNIDLGTLGVLGDSRAMSINNHGQIVGYAAIEGDPWFHAVLFDPTGGRNNIDLNTLTDGDADWELITAECINDRGWIVGQGVNPDGELHAYLLTPEPGTLAVMLLGAMLLRTHRRNRL
ncbi:MAG: hypothetical protein JXN61_07940 [Sedimentisphaerales bacterium]|nr:hypothetical protein [Sedimentisphaerales bacterium]